MNTPGMSELLYMQLRHISAPFDAGKVCELKFEMDGPYKGETYLRVPAAEVVHWKLGDEYTLRLRRV